MMYTQYLVTIVLSFWVITNKADDLFSFHQDRALLSECIDDYLLNSKDPGYRKHGNSKIIADLAAQRFVGNNETVKTFNMRVGKFMYDLKRRQLYLFKNYQIHKLLH